jgi:hypothetical protein
METMKSLLWNGASETDGSQDLEKGQSNLNFESQSYLERLTDSLSIRALLQSLWRYLDLD